MTNFCRVEFTDVELGNKQTNGTNHLYHNLISEGKYYIDWKLLDNSTVDKFIKVTKEVESERMLSWNRYITSVHSVEDNEEQVNELISDLNDSIEIACEIFNENEIDDNFKIDIKESNSSVLRKLNGIHFRFEKKLMSIPVEDRDTIDNKEVVRICEKLNQLVHSLEPFYAETLNTDKRIFTVIRQEHPPSDSMKSRIDADDDDYKRFDINYENGDLFSDFYTVGKDLGAAWITNDLELIKNNEVKQQAYISGAVNFTFDRERFQKDVQNDYRPSYYRWLERNDVQSAGYDFYQPKFNLGRAKLGELVDKDLDKILANIAKYPNICNIRIVDDDYDD